MDVLPQFQVTAIEKKSLPSPVMSNPCWYVKYWPSYTILILGIKLWKVYRLQDSCAIQYRSIRAAHLIGAGGLKKLKAWWPALGNALDAGKIIWFVKSADGWYIWKQLAPCRVFLACVVSKLRWCTTPRMAHKIQRSGRLSGFWLELICDNFLSFLFFSFLFFFFFFFFLFFNRETMATKFKTEINL